MVRREKPSYISLWELPGKTLVIAEKPKAASKIANALSRKLVRRKMFNIPYYVIPVNGKTVYVASAAGHLYGLYTSKREYPVFAYEWKPLYEIERSSKYTYKFLKLLEKLCKEANNYVNACDYDIEGSVIGYLIIEKLGDPSRSYRAKFSSLTPEELRSAFKKLTSLDREMIEAGLCRHELDWIWGINISRALMDSVYKVTGKKLVLSAGRVQTPTLKHVIDNDVERKLFIPIPQYTLLVDVVKNGRRAHLEYKGPPIDTRREALALAEKIREEKYLLVEKYEEKKHAYNPPPAFNLGDLQSEAARLYGFSPYKTQSIAEKLYLDALISYPRTNSQKLPPTLNYKGIMDKLRSINSYSKLVNELLSETRGVLKPVQGPKEDPAHPAIYPTGLKPSGLNSDEWKVYDLIVRRFLAAFAPRAVVEHRSAWFKSRVSDKLVFYASGQRIVAMGWFKYYPFSMPEEKDLPRFRRGEEVAVVNSSVRRTYTKPPERLSRIKILKWMENVGIGTEATRARIIELLFKRKYLRSSRGGAEATDLGLGVIEVLNEYFPELTSVKLTRYFEEEMEKIKTGLRKREEVVAEARKTIVDLLGKFNAKRELIGEMLGIRLGLIKPRSKCLICSREAWKNDLCKYHFRAYEELQAKYSIWRKKEGVDWSEYVRSLKKLRSTGKWVRELIKVIDQIG